MGERVLLVLLMAALIASGAVSANATKAPTYILNGYSFGGMRNLNTAELEAKLKDKPGARITESNIVADKTIVARELEARHIKGRLFASIAENNGRVWVIFDLLHPESRMMTFSPNRHLEAQNFEGASHISADALIAATGLKKGELLSPEKVNAARRAILAEYARFMPGRVASLKVRMRIRPDGEVTLTWIISEPK